MAADKWGITRWWGIFILSLGPLAYLIYRIVSRDLGPDPGEAITRFSGLWALNFLLITLAVTPVNQWLKLRWLVRFRRMLGLYSWFYATLHFTAGFLLVLDIQNFVQEITKRPYITVGFVAFVILVMLAATSPKFMVRKLGRNWKKLHKLVYLSGVLAVVHFIWLARADYTEPFTYASILALLLVMRPAYRRFGSASRARGAALN
ncbi:sulfite oxidase heme-binding subunit YedZ [Hahella sp. NBU794]|uniref:sulfite oxidase heme-binding subunit YedZ n=1 Tax=Hahella sp. NBU794 TaxID=3422590 RepID=UPI003D6F81C1